MVEDSAESRKLLADLLTRLGFEVRTAENGQQALRVWAEWQPHVVWMDMRMPEMDGHTATRRIKETPQGQQTVIIAVSASVLDEQRTAMLADGCDDFVRKPIRAEEIVAQLVKHLGVRMVDAAAPRALDAAAGVLAGQDAQADFALSGLRSEWVSQLHRAAVAADGAAILQLAEEAGDARPALAAALRDWVDQYDYDAILATVAAAGLTTVDPG